MEDCITIDELFETYRGIIERDNRNVESIVGADGEDPVEQPEETNLIDKLSRRNKETAATDAIDFGDGIGIGYKRS